MVSADTDVFVLLCSNLAKNNWYSANLYMDTFTEDNKLINVNKSVHNNKETIPSLIVMHALSGCDSVPMMFGIGKAKALKTLKNVPLKSIGDINADLEEVMNEGFTFVANCYGQKDTNSSKNRQTIWMKKTDDANKSSKPPTLKSLPPTNEALEMNIKRAHYAVAMWSNALSGHPPELDPCNFGWEKSDKNMSLRPIMLPAGTEVAPEQVLQMTRCKCASSQCRTNRCSCVRVGLNCTEFCSCQECANRRDTQDSDDESEDDNNIIDDNERSCEDL